MTKKKHMNLVADEEEQARTEFIKKEFRVKTNSAAMRASLFFTSDAKGFSVDKNVPMRTTKGEVR